MNVMHVRHVRLLMRVRVYMRAGAPTREGADTAQIQIAALNQQLDAAQDAAHIPHRMPHIPHRFGRFYPWARSR